MSTQSVHSLCICFPVPTFLYICCLKRQCKKKAYRSESTEKKLLLQSIQDQKARTKKPPCLTRIKFRFLQPQKRFLSRTAFPSILKVFSHYSHHKENNRKTQDIRKIMLTCRIPAFRTVSYYSIIVVTKKSNNGRLFLKIYYIFSNTFGGRLNVNKSRLLTVCPQGRTVQPFQDPHGLQS